MGTDTGGSGGSCARAHGASWSSWSDIAARADCPRLVRSEMDGTDQVDLFVRRYLEFRGLAHTARALETDRRTNTAASTAMRIADTLVEHAQKCQSKELLTLWKYIRTELIEHPSAPIAAREHVRKVEEGLFRILIEEAGVRSRPDATRDVLHFLATRSLQADSELFALAAASTPKQHTAPAQLVAARAATASLISQCTCARALPDLLAFYLARLRTRRARALAKFVAAVE
eukprot:gnl/Chilomastix_cuspidata/4057.p1 GENE.gnl/Chilomastix_cuspidata/4057~~gnl/Chilomastix_cuspidata/4057.p1  ORF type:complete len:231 (+),score=27.49 gnl/Chilomastix_cuspidata/4057:407-1099(+)